MRILLWFNGFCCCCSVAQSYPTVCDPMDCSTPGFPVHHHLPEFPQTNVQWCHPAISSSVVPFSSCPQSLPASGAFPMSQFLASGGQRIGASASASVIPSEYSGLISFRVDWFDLLAVQGQAKLKPGGSHPGLHRSGSSTSVLQTLPPPTSPLPRVPAPAGEMHAQGGRSAVNLRHLNVGLELQ